MTKSSTANEFVGFLANPAALKRGGRAVRMARGRQRRGLLERLAQAEANRALRREVTRRQPK